MAVFCQSKGESFHHRDFGELLKESSDIWKNHRIQCIKSWVSYVNSHFLLLEPETHVRCLVALSSCPLLIKEDGQLRVLLSLPEGCHLMPSAASDFLQVADEYCGYDEEQVMCLFLEAMYQSGADKLIRDVEVAHSSLTAHGGLSHSIRYMHDRMCKSSQMPPFIDLILRLPYHICLQTMMLNMLHFIQQASSLRKCDLVTYMLIKPLELTNDVEWRTIKKCREICNFHWHPRHTRVVTATYGNHKWSTDWNSTSMRRTDGSNYHEKWEERLLWVSVWFAGIQSGMISLADSPKLLLLRLAMLIT